jgi:hypothetical protein
VQPWTQILAKRPVLSSIGDRRITSEYFEDPGQQ